MNVSRFFSALSLLALTVASVSADDLLGTKRGGGGKSGSSSNSSGGSRSGGNNPAPSRDRDGSSRQQPRNTSDSFGRSSGKSDEIQRRAGRSGQSNYGSVNNRNGRSSSGSDREISRRANRQDNARPSSSDHHRSGYYHYNPRWSDDWFSYPYYRFDYGVRVILNPFSCYPHVPAYLDQRRVRPWNITINWNTRDWRDCDWNYSDRYDRWDEHYELNSAVRDLTRVYTKRDFRALSNLISSRERIRIQTDDRAEYGVDGDDFYDMVYDAVSSVQTRRFEVTNVQVAPGYAKVAARHEWVDPWRQTETTYHIYYLEQERGRWVIVDFSASSYRQ